MMSGGVLFFAGSVLGSAAGNSSFSSMISSLLFIFIMGEIVNGSSCFSSGPSNTKSTVIVIITINDIL